jgi:hypothetical protein
VAPASVALPGRFGQHEGGSGQRARSASPPPSCRASTRRATTPRSTRSTPDCSRSRNSPTTSRPSPTA